MNHGARPTPLDKRDLSYHRSFGTITPPSYPDSLNLDLGKTMPDQNADGRPNGCRAYTLTDIATDEDQTIYKIDYTCEKIALYEDTPTIEGGDIRTAMKVGQIYGVQALAEDTDQEAETHRRGSYYNIYDDGPTDWFDSFRTALTTHNAPISLGTPWFPSWLSVGADGVLPMPTPAEFAAIRANINAFPWHNHKVSGFHSKDSTPVLNDKSWQGPNIGDHGWVYFPRDVINAVMELPGCVAYIQPKANPQDTQTITISLYQAVVLFLHRILGILQPFN